jgi:leader peptidase (prepilin peptidase)/N-methyltransferase
VSNPMFSMTTRLPPVPIPLAAIAASSTMALIVLLASVDVERAGIVGLVALVPATLAAIVDVKERRLPNELVVLAAIPGLIFALWTIGSGQFAILGQMVQGVLLFAGPLFAIHLVEPTAMGYGDVKLAAALGLAVGAIEPRLALFSLAVAALGTVLVGFTRSRSTLPFGPGLVLGVAAALTLTFATGLEACL